MLSSLHCWCCTSCWHSSKILWSYVRCYSPVPGICLVHSCQESTVLEDKFQQAAPVVLVYHPILIEKLVPQNSHSLQNLIIASKYVQSTLVQLYRFLKSFLVVTLTTNLFISNRNSLTVCLYYDSQHWSNSSLSTSRLAMYQSFSACLVALPGEGQLSSWVIHQLCQTMRGSLQMLMISLRVRRLQCRCYVRKWFQIIHNQ